ncbi:C45 family autoproteolytic acyltransferase/hydrolase [Amycolatopsis sp. QT-25]|uniref:C45 family autoproteolytic acyltransferase/hydolase n=1 Tax=Amycolatopsis sp. QT-25 TaxID=3034022 RepID=UPI0023ED05C9|nr:C45 family peptidase [Amycolatopsis sp. QT-25]WET76282.1 C45 family autoproteolytic acyltransferase/hydrolase [Amycolatopsis sp. QT-25]
MTVPCVRAHGDAFTRGRAHGETLATELRHFLGDRLARLNALSPDPLSLDALRPDLAEYARAIDEQMPDLGTEIRGLAEGAGITHDEAVLLQMRREVLGYQKLPTMGDCTTYARTGSGPVLAQTVDLNGDLDDHLAVLDVRTGQRRSLVLSFGGLLGYLGVNDAGLAVGLNLVLAGKWRHGPSPYLAIRHLLDTCDNVAEAVETLRGLRLASSRSVTLCDLTTTAWVEIADDDLRSTEGPESVHTNHFLHPDLAPRDELTVFARNFSLQRLKAGQAGIERLPEQASTEDHFALLSRAPVRVAGNGDIRRERTVAAVVLRPDRGELHVRPGDPAHSPTETFTL